ncbi:MAG TPA: hypothetical protein VMV93_15440 [Chloroflexota bacterium]|nr:hypothetical protein [Chloroflexota bacterium]
MMSPEDETRAIARNQRESVRPAPPGGQAEQVVQNEGGVQRRERVVTDGRGSQHYERVVRDVASERDAALVRLSQLIWLALAIVDGFIGLRVIFKLIAANPGNAFAAFIYNVSAWFLGPFFGLTGSPAAGRVVLEVPSIIAMLVYALIAWAVVKVVWLALSRPATRGASTYDRRIE